MAYFEAVGYYGRMVYGCYDQVAIQAANKVAYFEAVGYYGRMVFGVYDYVPILGAV